MLGKPGKGAARRLGLQVFLPVEDEEIHGGVDHLERIERLLDVLELPVAEGILDRDLHGGPEQTDLFLHGLPEILAFLPELHDPVEARDDKTGRTEAEGHLGRDAHDGSTALRIRVSLPR